MKHIFYMIFCLLLINSVRVSSQDAYINEEKITLKTETGNIEGILRLPKSSEPIPVVLFIGGSGPTDRDGNQPMMQNNSLRFLSEALYERGIASLCFDKRGIGESQKSGKEEKETILDDFVNDANSWVDLLQQQRFSEIDILGHSEGALIGMLVAKNNHNVNKFISVAGPGKKIGNIILDQIVEMKVIDIDTASYYIEQLEKGEFISNIPPNLNALFRPSIQPFLISTFKYDPPQILSELRIPILIIQGTTDIQIPEKHAELLAQANIGAKKVLISGMNHVLKNCDTTDQQSQIITYINPTLLINEELVNVITEFIDKD